MLENTKARAVEPGQSQKNQQAAADTPILPMPPQVRERVERRARLEWDVERSRASRELDALLEEMYPQPTRQPSTFMMTSDERRAYGRCLMSRDGWQLWEVLAVLAAPEGVAA